VFLAFLTPFQLEVEAIVERRNGKIDVFRQPAHSPLKNWVQLWKALLGYTQESVIDTSGVTQTVDGRLPCTGTGSWCNGGSLTASCRSYLYVDAGEGDSSFGLVAGYGTAPVSMDDYKLANKYEHGSGLGYLFYKTSVISLIVGGETTINNKTYKTMTLIIQRPVENRHTDSQTITEIGLILYYNMDGGSKFRILIYRDVLDTPITLSSTEAATLRYHMRWLIPKS